MRRPSTIKAAETARREVKSESLEVQIDRILERRLGANAGILERGPYFEIQDKLVMFYKYSYGMQSRFFKELKERKRLLGSRCEKCGVVYFPPRANCSECYEKTEWREVSQEGEVLCSTTSWYTTSEFFRKVPYATGYVKPIDADTAILQKIALGKRDFVEPGTRVVARFKGSRRGSVSDFWYEVKA